MIPRYGIRIQTVLAMRHISSMRGGCNGMLNIGDIEFMKESQDEIYELRCRPITLYYVEAEYDEESGIEIGETEKDIEADAVIIEISMRKCDGSRIYEGGIEYEKDDIKIDVKID